jgi:5-methylcytosine-specific restriction endonuclease McrA/transposase
MGQRMAKFEVTKEELEKLYQGYSCAKIGKMYGVNAETVRLTLKRLGIQLNKNGGRRSFDPPREVLESMYQEKSMRDIANDFGVGETIVHKRLKEHGIILKEHGNHRLKPGRIFSEEHLENLRKSRIENAKYGAENPNWRGGITDINRRARQNWQARVWRENALKQAGNKCQECGVENGKTCECCGVKVKLHVHHVKSFAKHPEHRYDPTNSEVLCPKCHHNRHQLQTG